MSVPLSLHHCDSFTKKENIPQKETVGEFLTHKASSRLSRAVLVEARVGIRRRRSGEGKRVSEALAQTSGT